MQNRISKAIAMVDEHLKTLNAETVKESDAKLAIDFQEHFAYQEAQAQAHASGTLSFDEAQIVYAALGEVGSKENGGWAAGATTGTKFVVTKLVGELLAKKIAGGVS